MCIKKLIITTILCSSVVFISTMAIVFRVTERDKQYVSTNMYTYNIVPKNMNVNIQQEVKQASDYVAKYDSVNAEKSSSYVKQNTNVVNNVPNVVSVDQSTGAMTFNTGNADVDKLLHEVTLHLGAPYQYGAIGPTQFDCSGLTQYCYRQALGKDITRTTYTQITQGKVIAQADMKPGDLVFPHAGHVGIYVGNNMMIHAPQTGDVVKIGPVYKWYAARRIVDW